jgi:glycosyltransferase involved in cell wall biosynthesis
MINARISVERRQEITLFVPFYNEGKRAGVNEYLDSLSKLNGVKLVLVNDGSTDHTLEILNTFLSRNIDIVTHLKNLGKGEALRQAMLEFLSNNCAAIIGYLDCDGAFPLETVSKILEVSKEKLSTGQYQVCIASRVMLSGRKVERLQHRHYISRIVITLLGLKFIFMPYDSQSGFKIFNNSEQFQRVLEKPFRTRWLFDIELLDRLTKQWKENIIWEEPVQEWSDKPGSHLKIKSALTVIKEVSLLLFSRVES